MKKTIDGKTFYLSGSWADKVDALREAKIKEDYLFGIILGMNKRIY